MPFPPESGTFRESCTAVPKGSEPMPPFFRFFSPTVKQPKRKTTEKFSARDRIPRCPEKPGRRRFSDKAHGSDGGKSPQIEKIFLCDVDNLPFVPIVRVCFSGTLSPEGVHEKQDQSSSRKMRNVSSSGNKRMRNAFSATMH